MDYKKAYILLVKAISEAIDEIDKSCLISWEMENGLRILKEALSEAEDMYISGSE